jgi:outer membrane protein assembly factor BamB
MSKNKTAIAISLFLMFAMIAALFTLPDSNALDPPRNIPTYAYISAEPNPVGVGQNTYLGFWLDKLPPTAYQEYGDRWHNYEVTVTDPDGHTDTLGPFTSDDAGGAFTIYVPDKVGTYTFVFDFPGQTVIGENPSPLIGTYNALFVGDYFEPSHSETLSVTVQEEPITSLPQTPLPTGYWQRPIFPENLDWYTLGGNWLGYNLGVGGGGSGGGYYNMTANYNPYSTAPNTAHILWTKPYGFGGLMGGDFGGTTFGSNYNTNNQYQPHWDGIIMNGVAYYNLVSGSTANPNGWVAVDLRTGEELWTKKTESLLRTGQVVNIKNPNQYGGFAYLWALPLNPYAGTTSGSRQHNNTWEMYDAMTGDWILNIVNAPTSRAVINENLTVNIAAAPLLVSDENGNLLGYYANYATNQLIMWNSTLAIYSYNYMTGRSVNSWVWCPPLGANIDWNLGVQWSAPMATTITAPNGTSVPLDVGLGITKIASDVLLMTGTPEVGGYRFWNPGVTYEAGYSAIDGTLLWGPIWRTQTEWTRVNVAAAGNGIYYEFNQETMSFTAFSLKTGKLVWGPVALDNPDDVYGYYVQSAIAAYGGLYMCDLGGYVYALDAKTGARLWTFYTGNSGLETPYGTYPLYNMPLAADGKIFVLGGHEYSPPLYRGALLYCLNATTGEVLWTSPNCIITNQPNCALSDGYLLMPNGYDNQLYCFGKGLSATTVSAPETTQTLGTEILIKGTVTDQSPGDTCLGIPAAGTPAIADESMDAWMEYLYMQQEKPSNATGVGVTITVLDPNGNCYDVGTTTSTIDGFYKLSFTPPVPGEYYVYATFTGSESYYGSSAVTAINVETPTATQEPTPTPASNTDMIVTGFGIGAIIAIVVIGLVIILMLRKR